MRYYFPSYEVQSYRVELIREHDDGKTAELKTYDTDTFEDANRWLNGEMWSYWDAFKMYIYAMNVDTGEVEEILLR